LAGRGTAQTFTILYNFPSDSGQHDELTLSGNTLYGSASTVSSPGSGSVFAVNIDGTGFTTLYLTNPDEGLPNGGLVLSGNTLYGTAMGGGSSGCGTAFKVNTDGTAFTTLHGFTGGSDGGNPNAGLVLSGNTLYGTASGFGSSVNQTVFALNTDGTAFSTLHSFTGGSDGGDPNGGLVLSGNTLYGSAREGGSSAGASGNGTVFAVKTDGTGFRNVHSFTASPAPDYTNSDGAWPGKLLLSGNTLYGTALGGGSSGNGTLFKVNTDGTGFTTLYSFTALSAPVYQYGTNSDGVYPIAGLVLSGNTLYGMANHGGSWSFGTVFAINTDGTGFTNLHSFTSYDDGGWPGASLSLSGNTLYGVAGGGSSGCGVLFSISLPSVGATPRLTVIPSGDNVVLSWPTSATGFTLQSTTNLGSSPIWTTNLPAPVIFNGQNAVTIPISGGQQFFRLSQ
jgi:uncharacterized repeat protein (TIGR03803 family)